MKKIILFLMCALITVTMGACKSKTDELDSSGKEASAVKIAIVPKALDNPIFLEAKVGGEAKASELGIMVEWAGSASSDTAEQIAVIEGLIEKGVDGILISCNDATELNDVLDKAADAGITVATFDSDSPDSKRAFYIGSDNKKIGEKCAEYINELIPGGGKIAVLTGIPGAPNLELRIDGFKNSINANFEILPIQSGDDDIKKSVDIVNSYTAANSELAGWVFVGGWPFNAEPEELTELRKFMEAGGVCVSVDTLYPMLQFVKLDMAQVLVGQDYYKMGSDGVQYLYDIIKTGKKPSSVFLDTGYEIVDKENVDEVLAHKTAW